LSSLHKTRWICRTYGWQATRLLTPLKPGHFFTFRRERRVVIPPDATGSVPVEYPSFAFFTRYFLRAAFDKDALASRDRREKAMLEVLRAPPVGPPLKHSAPHEFGLGPGHDTLFVHNLRLKTIERRTKRQHPRSYFQRGVARNRLHEANMKVCRDRLNSMMKKAVRHCRIQQCGNDASVKDVVVSLKLPV
jgi:hypothetical protein